MGLRSSRFAHKAVAVGGTFDLLHDGHVRLLAKAFELGENVFIGLSSDQLVSTLRKTHSVRPFAARERDLRELLKARGWLSRARIVELRDPFGPAIRRRHLGGLIVSGDTRGSGRRVNAMRRRRGLPPLRIYVVTLVNAEDGRPISSSRVKAGEIDAHGKLIS